MRFKIQNQYFEVTSLPGCTQVAVSHDLFTPPKHRGKGYGLVCMQLRLNLIKNLGYDVVMCTVTVGNKAQEKVLIKAGWTAGFVFASSKTGNYVKQWSKVL